MNKLFLALCVAIVVATTCSKTEAAPCNSDTMRFRMLSSTASCGTSFEGLLSTTRPDKDCALSSGGALTCDAQLNNCVHCTTIAVMSDGVHITCTPTNSNGIQVVTVTYALGPLLGTIANVTTVSACNPTPVVPVPVTPIVHPPSEPCDSATVHFELLSGPRVCGSAFQALLSTSDPKAECRLSSGGLLACDANRRNCAPCSAVATTSDGLLYTCQPTNYNGVQQITATYQLGNFIGTIATSDSFSGCVVV